jgi:hypothetical protein
MEFEEEQEVEMAVAKVAVGPPTPGSSWGVGVPHTLVLQIAHYAVPVSRGFLKQCELHLKL